MSASEESQSEATPASCLCGAIAFQYTGAPLGVATELCHCISCQKWSGSAFTSNITIDKHHLSVTKGTPARHTTTGLSGKKVHSVFCRDCGSGLWVEPESTPQWICVKAGVVDSDWVRSLGVGIGTEAMGRLEGKEKDGGGDGKGEPEMEKHVDVEFFVKDRVRYLGPCKGARQEDKM
jgi:hypothetical protein